MKLIMLTLTSSLALLIGPSFSFVRPPFVIVAAPTASPDSSFLRSASSANLGEIEAGKIAVQTSKSEAVKKIGQMMIADHTTAQTELVALANTRNVQIPRGPDTEHMNTNAQLSSLSGPAFDSAYLKDQLLDHKIAITLFESESQNGADDSVRGYASKYLPKLKTHLSMVKMHGGMASDANMQ